LALDVDRIDVDGVWYRHLPHRGSVWWRSEPPQDGPLAAGRSLRGSGQSWPSPDHPPADRPSDVFVGTDERQIESQRSRRDDAIEGVRHLLTGNRRHLVEHPQIKWHNGEGIPIDDRAGVVERLLREATCVDQVAQV
jgi:hypothetical protein